ncbi:hypothetical protein [Candidatus Mycoplasma mahonii]|uniref:hypothetical protein n=1 Tax=Candidatus Mycoplasma mahonii TaxID=3004105 RepID=UPI0026EC0BBD|nr:hypothetical protein [Candidatus Mycoplasma mahonii]WKX02353.1 hypothetical protein O3I44_03040 [Candidatus Mycoplasma mahonii]
MKKTKKLALGLGTLTTIIAPVAVAISCVDDGEAVNDENVQPVVAEIATPAEKANMAVQALVIDNFVDVTGSGTTNDTVLNSTITLAQVVVAIKAQIADIDAKALILDTNIALDIATPGTLQITVSGHGDDKVLVVTGFRIELTPAAAAVQALVVGDFVDVTGSGTVNSSVLNSAVTIAQVVVAIKAKIEDVNAKELILNTNIALDTATPGTLQITVSGHGDDKVLVLTGFRIESDPRMAAITAVQALGVDDFTHINRNLLNSAITAALVANVIKAKIDDVNVKALILDTEIALNADTPGILQITVSDHGDAKVLVLTGFRIESAIAAMIAVQALVVDDFVDVTGSGAANNTVLNSDITVTQVVVAIKAQIEDVNAKALILDTNIALDTATSGTLQITVSGHGDDKVLVVTGFRTS